MVGGVAIRGKVYTVARIRPFIRDDPQTSRAECLGHRTHQCL
jgi:hypothetical protein